MASAGTDEARRWSSHRTTNSAWSRVMVDLQELELVGRHASLSDQRVHDFCLVSVPPVVELCLSALRLCSMVSTATATVTVGLSSGVTLVVATASYALAVAGGDDGAQNHAPKLLFLRLAPRATAVLCRAITARYPTQE